MSSTVPSMPGHYHSPVPIELLLGQDFWCCWHRNKQNMPSICFMLFTLSLEVTGHKQVNKQINNISYSDVLWKQLEWATDFFFSMRWSWRKWQSEPQTRLRDEHCRGKSKSRGPGVPQTIGGSWTDMRQGGKGRGRAHSGSGNYYSCVFTCCFAALWKELEDMNCGSSHVACLSQFSDVRHIGTAQSDFVGSTDLFST